MKVFHKANLKTDQTNLMACEDKFKGKRVDIIIIIILLHNSECNDVLKFSCKFVLIFMKYFQGRTRNDQEGMRARNQQKMSGLAYQWAEKINCTKRGRQISPHLLPLFQQS